MAAHVVTALQEPAAPCLPRAICFPRHHLARRCVRADASTLVDRWSVADVSSLLEKMKAATMVKRGDPGIKTTVEGARDEMNRFVAYYRRNNKVAGAASFSTLYTAISTLSGHFQNYGPEYPVPAKRQKVAFPSQAFLPKPPFLRPSRGPFRLRATASFAPALAPSWLVWLASLPPLPCLPSPCLQTCPPPPLPPSLSSSLPSSLRLSLTPSLHFALPTAAPASRAPTCFVSVVRASPTRVFTCVVCVRVASLNVLKYNSNVICVCRWFVLCHVVVGTVSVGCGALYCVCGVLGILCHSGCNG